MHDLEYAYVRIDRLDWTPEMIAQVRAELDRGIKILSSRAWDGEKWVVRKGAS